MKILCAGDLHCWWPSFEPSRNAREPGRLKEWRRVAEAIVELAVKENCALALFPGDYFVHARPEPLAVLEVVRLFRALEERGVAVVGCSGNHDAVDVGKLGPVDLVGSFCEAIDAGTRWGITGPSVLGLRREDEFVAVAVLPWMKPVVLTGGPVDLESVSKGLRRIVAELGAQAGEMKPSLELLLAHWPLVGSTYANGFGPDGEPALELDAVKSAGFDLCVAGHVHKPQVLSESPLALHPGVATRGRLDEANVSCGAYIVDTSDLSHKFFELPARPIVVVRLSERAIADFSSGEWAAEFPDVEDAIVAVKYSATEEQARQIDHKEIVDFVYELGAYFVAGVYPEIEREERRRAAVITESMGPLEALSMWLDAQGELDAGIKKAVVDMAAELLGGGALESGQARAA